MLSPESPEDLQKQRQSLKAASLKSKIVRTDDGLPPDLLHI